MELAVSSADSLSFGGEIPGAAGAPAFAIHASAASPIPVLIAVPHAGRIYPPALTSAMREPQRAALRLEDRLVDELGSAVAAQTGAALVVAHAPRAMLDLNRAADDVDWEMIAGRPAMRTTHPPPGRRARSGLGLIPRRVPGLGEVWRGRLDHAELEARIAGIHAPYHARVAAELAGLRNRWGAALLLDLHSMPPLGERAGANAAAEFVVGDRFGATSDGGLVATAFACFAEAGARAAHNRPYAGGYALDRHAAPRRGLHALQLEVDRRSYLDASLRERGPGFAATADLLATLVRRLAAEVALLGNGAGVWPMAAE
ncbi:N-formylglutamate amidohydrolase [Novosphingobium sp. Gsoil 351]|uniref:N-formylglutamate amidohydrolase n=1 Tax=Novosphingobium sp. Gsoil 351 TaxID=2675225 RepID=UPI0012B479AA|nr:N-formylglutamate amidohydrolase [Novosphingobium sp. Gsoil 351]QGN53625.1 N-formylglutamate amidohydrolase [Novosphingobium sp. Gsoil 351]